MTENNNAVEIPKEPAAPDSVTVVGIRFRSCGKIYTFEVDDLNVVPGSRVVVDSEVGLSIGHVVTHKRIIEKTKEPLKKVLRMATDSDFETIRSNRDLENEARLFCVEKARAMNLPMKIVTTEATMDKKRLTFYFTADGRIDFRELVRDLAAKFKTRIEMRQIGVRDEVKLLGGFGCCGRQTCCSLFLTSFAPITIRMAKEQALSINQSKLSGVCGRLMCCLGYEQKDTSAEAATPSREETLVTVTEEASASSLLTEDSVTIEKTPPSQGDNIIEEKVKPVQPRPEQPQEKKEGRGHSRRDRRWKKRHRTDKAPAGSTQERAPARQPLPAPAPADTAGTTEKTESKGKGRPFNRRRKFWKKKQD